MEEDRNILARWSRLKREHVGEKAKKTPPRSANDASLASREWCKAPQADDDDQVFDVSQLPSLESIVAGSDIRAFLRKGVPPELTRAALRRAWSSDEAICNFIEMAENQWDFANASTIPGFGSLTAADDIPQLVAKALGDWRDLEVAAAETEVGDRQPADLPAFPDEAPSKSVREFQTPVEPELSAIGGGRELASAPQQEPSPEHEHSLKRRRRHGGALPS